MEIVKYIIVFSSHKLGQILPQSGNLKRKISIKILRNFIPTQKEISLKEALRKKLKHKRNSKEKESQLYPNRGKL